jgi:hypothetical protein
MSVRTIFIEQAFLTLGGCGNGLISRKKTLDTMRMRKYDKKFKKEVFKKYLDGQTVTSISREIGVNENLIHEWKKNNLSVSGAIVHTDRHGQCGAGEYRKFISIGGLRQNMSANGNCYDNARPRSFFSRFKAACLNRLNTTFFFIHPFYLSSSQTQKKKLPFQTASLPASVDFSCNSKK